MSFNNKFRFNRPNSLDYDHESSSVVSNVTTSTSNSASSNIHPLELIVQSIIGPSIESYSKKLNNLQESQMVLTSRIKLLQIRIANIDKDLDLIDLNQLNNLDNEINFKIKMLKEKLVGIFNLLKVIENRVNKISNNIILDQQERLKEQVGSTKQK
ncbi:uncharacterized protein ASCRUDRAFT_81896 [Ascoidea rubescens DSM 1968]|uniref:Uncharacterized protein n=1 Tax=Ascoidea rubescens DSM 1968 TaxID=1344418 RepID=A0A1D2VDC4_9ASCO|nr:hypothetical protein ASCRUDRAFT_81896 [Ascoidea rubescens DSM 1968]ODV59599.1 hypothetical protein ASCRUDRAFT_81896 [Ascoidea rubescens DSM 1968]